MDSAPEREASSSLVQHLVVAVQIAEAVIRLRQQGIERRATATEQAAAAARAEWGAQHTADRITFAPALDPEWTRRADLRSLGQAWGAAAGWSDTDPAAHVAATHVEARLSQLAPSAMARFSQARDIGADRIDAMRQVLTVGALESPARRVQRRELAGPAGASHSPPVDVARTNQSHATAAVTNLTTGMRATDVSPTTRSSRLILTR